MNIRIQGVTQRCPMAITAFYTDHTRETHGTLLSFRPTPTLRQVGERVFIFAGHKRVYRSACWRVSHRTPWHVRYIRKTGILIAIFSAVYRDSRSERPKHVFAARNADWTGRKVRVLWAFSTRPFFHCKTDNIYFTVRARARKHSLDSKTRLECGRCVVFVK